MKDLIEFTEFLEVSKKLEIRVGKIIDLEDVPKSNKLLKLTVDFGDEVRTVVTNIKPQLNPSDENIIKNMKSILGEDMSILNKNFLFVTNLKPVTMMGVISTAMIMPGETELGKISIVNCEIGTKIL
jgi:methionine--tRNA ligase beta chain